MQVAIERILRCCCD